jgi:CRP-like cAMP-binding protein
VAEKKSLQTACPTCKMVYRGIYTELPSKDVGMLSAHQSCELYKKGSSFFHEGSRPNGIFFIHKGKVKIYKHGDGREQIIKIAQEGELLGYRAILADEQFPVSAKTLEDCHLCFIPKHVFLEALLGSPAFSQKILKEACRELDMMTGVLTNMAQKTVHERIVHTLLELSNMYGENAINLKREDMAGLVGTATETLIRFLSQLKEAGWIEIQGRKIKVIDKTEIKKFAKIY